MKYIVECSPDESLVVSLTEGFRRPVVHRSNKPEVLKYLVKSPDARGLIDEDPLSIQPPLMRELKEIDYLEHLGLRRSKFPNGNAVIVLCPRLEEWTLGTCRELNVRPESYNLSSQISVFRGVINQRIENFGRLISALKDHSERLQTLSKWLRND